MSEDQYNSKRRIPSTRTAWFGPKDVEHDCRVGYTTIPIRTSASLSRGAGVARDKARDCVQGIYKIIEYRADHKLQCIDHYGNTWITVNTVRPSCWCGQISTKKVLAVGNHIAGGLDTGHSRLGSRSANRTRHAVHGQRVGPRGCGFQHRKEGQHKWGLCVGARDTHGMNKYSLINKDPQRQLLVSLSDRQAI